MLNFDFIVLMNHKMTYQKVILLKIHKQFYSTRDYLAIGSHQQQHVYILIHGHYTSYIIKLYSFLSAQLSLVAPHLFLRKIPALRIRLAIIAQYQFRYYRINLLCYTWQSHKNPEITVMQEHKCRIFTRACFTDLFGVKAYICCTSI